VARRFAHTPEFGSSPRYRALARTVVGSPALLRLAARGRPGQYPIPDLDALPPLASVTGVDLHPLDARDAADRRWLEALVWPENRHEADLLHRALAVVAADPPAIRAGDALTVCPMLAAALPPGEPRVVFHAITRLHVPAENLGAFDAALATLGDNAPLYRLSLEGQGEFDLRDPSSTLTHLATVGPRLEWITPRGD